MLAIRAAYAGVPAASVSRLCSVASFVISFRRSTTTQGRDGGSNLFRLILFVHFYFIQLGQPVCVTDASFSARIDCRFQVCPRNTAQCPNESSFGHPIPKATSCGSHYDNDKSTDTRSYNVPTQPSPRHLPSVSPSRS